MSTAITPMHFADELFDDEEDGEDDDDDLDEPAADVMLVRALQFLLYARQAPT